MKPISPLKSSDAEGMHAIFYKKKCSNTIGENSYIIIVLKQAHLLKQLNKTNALIPQKGNPEKVMVIGLLVCEYFV